MGSVTRRLAQLWYLLGIILVYQLAVPPDRGDRGGGPVVRSVRRAAREFALDPADPLPANHLTPFLAGSGLHDRAATDSNEEFQPESCRDATRSGLVAEAPIRQRRHAMAPGPGLPAALSLLLRC
jgi:hypothetical protein